MPVAEQIAKALLRTFKDVSKVAAETKNPKELIKQLERNGNLLYHGTPHGGFDKFSLSKRGTGADAASYGDYGKGIYLTTDAKDAQRYASGLVERGAGKTPYVHKVFLQSKNPYDMQDLGKRAAHVDSQYAAHVRAGRFNKLTDADWNEMYQKAGISESDYVQLRDIESSMGDNWSDVDFSTKLRKMGYDSIITPNGERVAFSSKNVKTAAQLAELWGKANSGK